MAALPLFKRSVVLSARLKSLSLQVTFQGRLVAKKASQDGLENLHFQAVCVR
jgi:hypothetical protein